MRKSERLTRYREKRLVSGYRRTKNCTSAHFLDHTYSAFTLRRQNYSLRSYMKGFVEAIQEEDICLIDPSLKVIDGQICKRKHRNM